MDYMETSSSYHVKDINIENEQFLVHEACRDQLLFSHSTSFLCHLDCIPSFAIVRLLHLSVVSDADPFAVSVSDRYRRN
eukprot:8689645-Pyramimonas_sp.AAC.1